MIMINIMMIIVTLIITTWSVHELFRGFDSSGFPMFRGGTPRSAGEVQTQRFSVCGFLVCGLTADVFLGSNANAQTQTQRSFLLENKEHM